MSKNKHSSPKTSKNTSRTDNNQSQADRMKKVESTLSNLLKTLDPDGSVHLSKSGGLDNRIKNIAKMTDKLSSFIEADPGARKTAELEPVVLSEASVETRSEHGPKLDVSASNQTIPKAAGGNKKRTNYVPLDFASVRSPPTNKHYMLKINASQKRQINPYEIIEAVETKTGCKPKSVTGYNALSFTIEVRDDDQGIKLENKLKIMGSDLEVCPHPFFNKTRGLVYIEDTQIDDVEEFQSFLKDRIDNLTHVSRAHFIKPRNPTTQVFILEFSQDTLPHSVYIPGERKDSTIYKLRNKPLVCNKCLQYGHPQKYCRATSEKCRRCAEDGHDSKACPATSPKCVHCEGVHEACHRDCPSQQKQEKLLEIQQSHKVTPRRARQILENKDECIRQGTKQISVTFNAFFDIAIEKTQKRSFTPWLLEKCLTGAIGQRPKSVRSKNDTTLIVEVSSEQQGKKLLTLKTLNNIPIKVEISSTRRLKKALVYIYNYDLSDFPKFRESLKNDLGVGDVELTPWIKPRNNLSKPLLISFYDDVPMFISIPGEQAKTQVYPYKDRPQICKKCTKFYHGEKHCADEERCARCSEEGHRADRCNADPMICPHCSGNHMAGNKNCVELRKQEEILAIQSNERVSRQQAFVIYMRNHPNPNMNYAGAVATPLAPSSSKSTLPPVLHSAATKTPVSKPSFITKAIAPTTETQSKVPLAVKPKPNTSHTPRETAKTKNPKMIDIICQSPKSGRTYTKTIEDPRRPDSPFDEHDLTSEDNPAVRAEAKRLFQEYDSEDMEDDSNESHQHLKLSKSDHHSK